MSSKKRALIYASLAVPFVLVGFFVAIQTIFANSVTSSVSVGAAVPTVSSVTINPAPIVLNPNTTTTVNVSAIIADNNGCSALTNGTQTIQLYRTALGSSCTANNLNCYTATAFTATSSCSGGTSMNVTTTFYVYYFAQATDASSSFSSDSWQATVNVASNAGTTSTANSATTTLQTVNAINITTSSINYGSMSASSTTGSVNQTTTVQNAGNSSTTLNLSGTALTSGANSITTSSQAYSTSTFTYPGTSTAITGTPVSVSGLLLTSPTTTTAVSQNLYWGLQVPAGTATGTFTGTNTFTSVFHT